MEVSNIFLTSDILMTKEKEQFSNLRWFRDFLTRRIFRATNINPKALTSSLANQKQLNRKKFFELSGIEVNIDDVQFYYDDNCISQASIEYLQEYIPMGSVVVAYELSRQTRSVFDRAGIVYIDIWLHPIRYLDDILFAFNSNSAEIHGKIAKYNLDEEYFYLYADKFKIGSYKGFKRVELPIEADSALFVGQTLIDKAICHQGKMLNLLDFKDKFKKLTSRYNKIYYSRHPFVGGGDKKILNWLSTFENVEIVNYSAYHMLSNSNIKSVHTLSSSVVHEAKYFGKQSEFWFKPIFNINSEFNKENYLSIYQEFVSPSFWSDILSPVMETVPSERVIFLSDKDKLRDMLGFYYSYKHVDKAEQVRQTLLAVDRKVQRIDKEASNSVVTKIENKKNTIKNEFYDLGIGKYFEAKKSIDKAKVVSFDIFDTLIQRRVANPNDIFSFMDEYARSIGVVDFPLLREKSRSLVEDVKGEEVPLYDRYMALVKYEYLDYEQAKTLLKLELDIEESVCERREIGIKLFKYAVEKKKRVILISDIFFDKSFVELLLNKAGIDGYEKLYVSSEVDLLKHTGNLFKHVIEDLSLMPENVIHFGDNNYADGDMAIKNGLKSFILPSNKTIAERVSYYSGELGFQRSYVESVSRGLVNNRLTSGMFSNYSEGVFGDDPGKFGYCIMGPMLSAFAAWLLKKAKADGIDKLYFLARDGEIIKRCYDILASVDDEAPQSEYLLCSRRAVNIPKMYTVEDIFEVASANFSPVRLKDILLNRFGINASLISNDSLLECGFDSINDIVRYKEDEDRFKKLLELESGIILSNAEEERNELIKYFDSKDFLDDGSYSVVDIGHNGTMQRSLAKLVNKPKLGGYYFMTFKGAAETLGSINLPYDSFLGRNVDENSSGGAYFKYILMFEMLFLNTSGSFVRFKNGKKIKLPLRLEKKRVDFISGAHNGCVSFVRDWIDTLGKSAINSEVDVNKVITPYVKFLENPRVADANMFEGICFENVYSARDSKYIIKKDCDVESAVWKEGQNIINQGRDDRNKLVIAINLACLSANKLGILDDKKYRKFKNDPNMFFKDSKFSILRRLGGVR